MAPFHPLAVLSLVLSIICITDAVPCSLCRDGSEVTRPDKLVNVPGLEGDFHCQQLDALAPIAFPDANAEGCRAGQDLSTLCGCPREEDSCDLCPDGTSVVLSDTAADTRLVPEYTDVFAGVAPSCELLEAYLHSFSKEHGFCAKVRRSSAARCGCPAESLKLIGNSTNFGSDDEPDPVLTGIETLHNFGATNDAESARRQSVSLFASIFSIFGSLCIIADNIRSTKLKKNLYNQIMFNMAVFDTILSVATAFGAAPIPSGTSGDNHVVLYGEEGNHATCQAQGYFIQLGSITSMFFNVSLSTYFVMVIVYGARSSLLRKVKKYMIGVPILLGLILSFSALPFITESVIGCHLSPPGPSEQFDRLDFFPTSWGPFLGLWLLPAWITVVYTTGALASVYWHVRSTNNKADKWSWLARVSSFRKAKDESLATATSSKRQRRTSMMGGSSKLVRRKAGSKLQNEVFWQSASYLFALYLSWMSFLIGVTIFETIMNPAYYEFWVFVSFLYPLQGFFNACVYFRARVVVILQKHQKNLAKKLKWGAQAGSTGDLSLPVDEEPPEAANALVAENEIESINDVDPRLERESTGDLSLPVDEELPEAAKAVVAENEIESQNVDPSENFVPASDFDHDVTEMSTVNTCRKFDDV